MPSMAEVSGAYSMSRIAEDRNKTSSFEPAGVLFIASSKRSLKLEIRDSNRVFQSDYYISIKDVENVLNGKKQTAQIVKLISEVNNST